MILVADDDKDDFLLVTEAFREAGIKADLRLVGDGVELLDYLKRHGKYEDPSSAPFPDLILLDLNMPKKDGREVLREVKADQCLQSIPVVILTTSTEENDIQLCYRSGANSFMTKPVGFDRWIEGMRTLASYWFEWNLIPPKRPLEG
jgi:CheY-like chemotaxis protein